MSNWRTMLKEAKELFDDGLISDAEYGQMRKEALALRGQSTQVEDAPSATTEDELSGETQMFVESPAIKNTLSVDPLAGATQFVPEVEIDGLMGGPSVGDPLSSDTLAGGTQFVPDFDMDAGNDTLSGVTMMGQVVSLNDDNIENLPPGALFDGRYSVVAPLGKGGMGMVYEVVDPKVKQRVALKVLRPEIANNPKIIQSFAEEVAIGQRLNHPNLLQIRHLETRSDSPYVIMELMDGGDVDEQLAAKGGKISAELTLNIMKQTCSALLALHNERIIHLDLKPQNLLMNSDGTVKLSDFGISSSLKDQRGGHSGSGTLFYSPPEQMDGGQCDVRTDIYALGMMTGQLLAGRFPFALKKAEEVKEWHRSGSRDFGYLSGKVSQVLGTACAVSIDERYRTVSEFIGELEKALDHKPWYPASLSLESVHPSLVLVNGKEHTMDVANLLPQGVLTPSLTLKGGKVLMQSNPFALAEVGVLDYLSSKLKPVVKDILSGSDTKLSGLSKQDSTTESHLAMLSTRCELPGRTVQRRLYYASDSLSTQEDRLTLAYTHRTAVKDVKSANDLLEQIQQGDIAERLEVSRHQRWLELDERGVQRKMFAIEEDCKTSEDWQGLASAHVSLFVDWNSADGALTKSNQKQPSGLEQAIDTLQRQSGVYGLRTPLKEAGARLDNLADSPADYAKISGFWKNVGAGDAASKAEEERQSLFRARIQFLVKDLKKLDAYIVPPLGILVESDVQEYELRVKEQKELHSRLKDIQRQLSSTNIPIAIPSGVLTKNNINILNITVQVQIKLYKRINQLTPFAVSYSIEIPEWEIPYVVEEVDKFENQLLQKVEGYKQSVISRLDSNNLSLQDLKHYIEQKSSLLDYEKQSFIETNSDLEFIELRNFITESPFSTVMSQVRKTVLLGFGFWLLYLFIVTALSVVITDLKLFTQVSLGSGYIILLFFSVNIYRNIWSVIHIVSMGKNQSSLNEQPLGLEIWKDFNNNFLKLDEFESLNIKLTKYFDTRRGRLLRNQKLLLHGEVREKTTHGRRW